MNEISDTGPIDVQEDEIEMPAAFNIADALSNEGLTSENFDPANGSHLAAVLRVISQAMLSRMAYKKFIGHLINLLGNKITSSQLIQFAVERGIEKLLTQDEVDELVTLRLIVKEQQYGKIDNLRSVDDVVKQILRRLDTLLAQSCQLEARAVFRKEHQSVAGLVHQYGLNFEPINLSLEGEGELPRELVAAVSDIRVLQRRLLLLQAHNRTLRKEVVDIGKRIEETVKNVEALLRGNKEVE